MSDERQADTERRLFAGPFLEALDGIVSRLAGVIEGREHEFLELGETLMKIAERSKGLSDMALKLSERTSSGAVQSGAERLGDALRTFTDICESAEASGDREALKEIAAMVGFLEDSAGSFAGIVKKLRMLGISTRIESARLGALGRGFATLSDDVEKLAGKMVVDSESLSRRSRELGDLVGSAVQGTAGLDDKRRDCSETASREIGEGIETLESMFGASRRAAEELSNRTEAIRSNVSGIVSSLQFHDIVRQQVEHVENSFMEASSMLRDGDAHDPEGFEDHEEIVAWIGDLASLQSGQIENASSRFFEAVEDLKANLAKISENILGVAEDFRKALASDGADKGTVLESIESSLKKAMDSMGEYGRQGERIGEIMNGVSENVMEMKTFLGDIEEAGSEIELIALNASIRAARTGEEGKALGVLAQAIRNLSIEARGLTEEVSGRFKSIVDRSEELRKKSDRVVNVSELEKAAAGHERVSEEVGEANRSIKALFEDLSAESRSLGREVADLAANISFHEHVREDLFEAGSEAAALKRMCREAVADRSGAPRPERMQKLLERYTMEAERLVHQQSLGENPEKHEEPARDESPEEETGECHEAPVGGEEEWDNVELF
jgi:methyl-accepting chemotaxis protein